MFSKKFCCCKAVVVEADRTGHPPVVLNYIALCLLCARDRGHVVIITRFPCFQNLYPIIILEGNHGARVWVCLILNRSNWGGTGLCGTLTRCCERRCVINYII